MGRGVHMCVGAQACVRVCVSLCACSQGCGVGRSLKLRIHCAVPPVACFPHDPGRPAGPGFAAHLNIRTWEAGVWMWRLWLGLPRMQGSLGAGR